MVVPVEVGCWWSNTSRAADQPPAWPFPPLLNCDRLTLFGRLIRCRDGQGRRRICRLTLASLTKPPPLNLRSEFTVLIHLARLATAASILWALCTYGRSEDRTSPPAVTNLVESLKKSAAHGRAQAALELGRRDDLDADAKAALRQALADENRTVRGRAAVALWRLDRPPLKEALPALLAARNDADETIRTAADEAWAEIGPGVRAAMPFVRKSLATNVQEMQKAVAALSQPGLDAVPAILD